MKTLLTSLTLCCGLSAAYAQHSGNAVYGNTHSQAVHTDARKLFLTDSTFIIEARVLLNKVADSYVVTFGVADSSASMATSNEKINKRIKGFITSLGKFNIKQQDVYVDMTTQTKLYDYAVKGNVAEQYLKGFEIKKNVIISLKDTRQLDDIVIAASTFKIYDLVKVDYLVEDQSKINAQLFKVAADIIEQKKAMYLQATTAKLVGASQVYGEEYYSYSPEQLYKTYTASSSNSVSEDYSSSRLIRKNIRETPTVYFDKIDYSGFDKVINPSIVEPGIEFALNLQIKFQVEKPKK